MSGTKRVAGGSDLRAPGHCLETWQVRASFRMRLIPYLGYLAGVLTVIAMWPQTRRVWNTKQVHDLSLKTFIMLVTAGLLWVTYGILSTDWPVIATNAGMVVLNGAILFAKIKYS
jgi:MtN3 and saliva related transmembrane protein